jgi:hypothetical protein
METLVLAAVAWWAVYRLIVDGSYAIRGVVPPSGPRSRGRRYGARGYLGEVWSDGWRRLGDRRRARLARRAAGEPGWPRLARLRARLGRNRDAARAWWRDAGGSREFHRDGDTITDQRHETLWDRAIDHAEQKRAARRARKTGAADAASRPDPAPATPDGQPPAADPQRPVQPVGDADSTQSPAAAGGQPDPNGHRPTTDPGRVPSPDRRGTPPASDRLDQTGAAEPAGLRQPPQPPPNQPEGTNDMAEVTGLDSAINFAGDMSNAEQGKASEIESFIAHLQANQVSGEPIAQAQAAMEHHNAAAACWAACQAALVNHKQVQEAYNANPDAGRKEFVTAE